ncbi:Sodium-dependent transporter [Vibrio aerogenes]
MSQSASRDLFASRLGFILSASGAAVGLGNIWGFPTQVASNGGGAFLLVYLLLIVFVAFPMLVVEMAIGRQGQANPVDSVRALSDSAFVKRVGSGVGWLGLSVPSVVLAFYSIVGGWIVCFFLASLSKLAGGFFGDGTWLETFSVGRNLLGTLIFYVLTILIVQGGG